MLFIEDRDRRQWDRIERGILAILKADHFLIHESLTMSKELDDLTAEVAADTQIESSAITLINGLAAQIAAAGTDPAKLQALTDELTTSSNSLAAAVKANTTPAPTPEPVPVPPAPPAPPVATSPQISSISPTSGPEAGGTSVVISGTAFIAADGVSFGGVPAASVTIDGPGQITAVTPPGTGTVDVAVIGNTGNASDPQSFTYTPAAPAQ